MPVRSCVLYRYRFSMPSHEGTVLRKVLHAVPHMQF